jgi:hypothetical protein
LVLLACSWLGIVAIFSLAKKLFLIIVKIDSSPDYKA